MHRLGLAAPVLLTVAFFAGCTGNDDGVTLADIHGMALDPNDPSDLYVATHHGLFRAEDGADWRAVTERPFDMMGYSMHPSDASVQWASGHPAGGGLLGVAKSEDGGVTWNVIALAGQVDFHAMAVSPADPDRMWGFFGGKLWRSDDGGTEWASFAAEGLEPTLALAGHATERETVFAATTAGVLRSSDGGDTWEPLHAEDGRATTLATTQGEPDLLVASFAAGGLKRSTDGGATWTSLEAPSIAPNDGVAAVAVNPDDTQELYVGSYRGGVHRSTDGGAGWERLI